MKIKEQIEKCTQELEKVKSLATKTATNTEKYYWEVKELKTAVDKMTVVFSELTEALIAIIKEQMGD
ncbi:MAG: hypothetical protein IJX17_00120 [Clostridia bacterium]|nr:hypothetical protein [Clostridia bacterium]